MTTLVEFLRARLDEREARARAVDGSGRWSAYLEGGDDGWAVEDTERGDPGAIIGDEAMARHIAENDPDHVLREVEAKRQIAGLMITIVERYDQQRGRSEHPSVRHNAEYTLRLLAAPYATHPDYREEWRP